MKCAVCSQEIRKRRTRRCHHLEPAPAGALCWGCWSGCHEFEVFIFRATGLTVWGLTVERLLASAVRAAKCGRLGPLSEQAVVI